MSDYQVKVRDLEWLGSGDRIEASALGIEVFYRVEGEPGDWTLISPGKREYVRTPGYQTQAAAKEAAWVDFDRRIRAALTSAKGATEYERKVAQMKEDFPNGV